MKRKNYNNLLKKLKNQKFDELYQQKPFLTLPEKERHWWIRYYKLQVAAQKACWAGEFPKLPDGPITSKPWFEQNHWINQELAEIEEFVSEKLVDWEKLQDYQVDMVFCEGDCDGCKHVMICEIKKEGKIV